MSLSSRSTQTQSDTLPYSIYQCSPHSGRYEAKHILVNNPTDPSSRWSGAHVGHAKQWITVKLDSPAIVKSITFGKFHKPHICNMKEFKVYVGLRDDSMKEVLHEVLKNDNVSETFLIKHKNASGVAFPARYIKIVPLSAHGQSFHISIWHLSLSGLTDPAYVEGVRKEYEAFQETIVLRNILKHLRQRRALTPYQHIISKAGIQVEHPLVSELYETIVLRGDWVRAEELLERMSQAKLFDEYLQASQPYAIWTRLRGTDADGDIPAPRGGHAMCIDSKNGIIYLFGGWNGEQCLDDFWSYDTKTEKWHCIAESTAAHQHAPGPRSCHKMVFDQKTGSIYVLGRLTDSDELKPATNIDPSLPRASTENSASSPSNKEFYRYHTRGPDAGKWNCLSDSAPGGPPLTFDHQMVMDSEAQILYTFGGRVIDGDWESFKYSGLYSYNVRLNKWKPLQDSEGPGGIPSRYGHSMVLDSSNRQLFIFSGQRDERYLSDMFTFDLTCNTSTELFSNFTDFGGPDASFTQRAVIDTQLHEIYIFCGLTRSPLPGATTTRSLTPNWVYRYDSRPGKWTQILPQSLPGNNRPQQDAHEDDESVEPIPRYAHQVVYDPTSKAVYIHGGNAGFIDSMERSYRSPDGSVAKEKRLDDFWKMTLQRYSPSTVIRKATYEIRQQQFREMCEDMPQSPEIPLNFLKNEVGNVVDHSDPVETDTFRSLLTHLVAPSFAGPRVLRETSGTQSPPRKRSRPNTPEEPGEAEGQSVSQAIVGESLRATADPLESTYNDGKPISSARFTQRTDVFERLLVFVSEEHKQPSGSLLDTTDYETE